jgi:3-hydroxybutyryl-CoA dehydrogenase
MGCQIAVQCALHGLTVRLYDVSESAVTEAEKTMSDLVRRAAECCGKTAKQARDALGRIQSTNDSNLAGEGVDLLTESVTEDPRIKGEVLSRFGAICPPHTIFTTNSSTLVPSMMAAQTGRPDRFAAFHFHKDVWYANAVDIMPHPRTSPATLAVLKDFAGRIGQIPIMLNKESQNYVYNLLLGTLLSTALNLAVGDVTEPESVDRAWMTINKMRWGPFGMMDFIGLDVMWHSQQYWAKAVGDLRGIARAEYLKRFVDQDMLGVKTGKGFYTYPDPAFERPDFLTV